MKWFIIERPAWVSVVLLLVANSVVFGGFLPDAVPLTWIASSVSVLIWRSRERRQIGLNEQQGARPPTWQQPPVRQLPSPLNSGQVLPAQRSTPPSRSLAAVVQSLQVMAPVEPLDEQIEVAGETHHIRGIKAVFRDAGRPIASTGTTLRDVPVILVPEPWSEHDQYAVAVMVGVHQVGYIPAGEAPEYSRALVPLAQRGYLASARARIWAKDDGAVWARVTVTATPPEYLL